MNTSHAITPEDIRGQEFRRKMLGYNPDQVDAFLDELADQLELVQTDLAGVRERLTVAEQITNEYREIEETIKTTLIDAQKSASDRRKAAEAEASSVITKACLEAETVTNETHQSLSDVRRQIEELTVVKTRFISQIDTLLNSQMDHLRAMTREFDPDSGRTAPEAPPVWANPVATEREVAGPGGQMRIQIQG
jgi:cell division initiation protein